MTACASPSASAGSPKKTSSSPVAGHDSRLRIVPAVPKDHTAIFHFLKTAFQGPSWDEFRISLEDPFYRAGDRLLLQCGDQVLAHVHLTHRVMRFGAIEIPVGWVGWLGTLPACRRQGHGCRLLTAAEDQMVRDGAMVGYLWTRIPDYFKRFGWVVCGRRHFWRAGAREVLAGLSARGLHTAASRRLSIRPWRRVELGSLMRIYNHQAAGAYGPLIRTEEYWQWLVHRRGYDQIFVALDGPDLLEIEDRNAPIIGYAAVHAESIVEMCSAPRRFGASVGLLVRLCRDTIERGSHTVTLYAPSQDRLHRLFRAVGGTLCTPIADQEVVLMAKVLVPDRLLELLRPELLARAHAAVLPPETSWQLSTESHAHRFHFDGSSVSIESQPPGQGLLLEAADFTRMALGYLSWREVLGQRRSEPHIHGAIKLGRTLFPRLPQWHPPLDDLPARD